MRTLALANQKGGSGKTTTAINLAASLAARGRKVLIADLDQQASASVWLGIDGGQGLRKVLTSGATLAEVVRETTIPGVSLIPSLSWLMGIENELRSEDALQRALEQFVREHPAPDYVLLDCPPALGILTVNALVTAGEFVAPVEAHRMAVDGLDRLLETVAFVRERLNPHLALTGVLACRVDARTRHALDVVEFLRKRYPETFRTVIRENVRLAEAYSFGKPITTYAPSSAGAEDYRKLAAEVIRQEKAK
jgi:chromosome partitioning protein